MFVALFVLWTSWAPGQPVLYDHETKIEGFGWLGFSGDTLAIYNQVFVKKQHAWIRQAIIPQENVYGLGLAGNILVTSPNLYSRNNETWSLTTNFPAVGNPAISSNRLAFTYGRDVQIWEAIGQSWKTVATITISNSFALWNRACALDGDTLVVSSIASPDAPSNAVSSVYIFRRNGSNWLQETTFISPQPRPAGVLSYFGYALAVSGATVAVGDASDDTRDTRAGAVYLLVRTAFGWNLQQKLVPDFLSKSNYFGYSLALKDNMLVVGAPGDIYGWHAQDTGVAYVFSQSGSEWIPLQTLRPSERVRDGLYGKSVGIDTNAVVVGTGVRLAYVYEPASSGPFLPSVEVYSSAWNLLWEGSTGFGGFTVSRIGDTNVPLNVYYKLSGTAEEGADYKQLPGVVTIPAGKTYVSLEPEPLKDRKVEGDETIVLTLLTNSAYVVGNLASATARIVDGNAPYVVSVAAADPEASEDIPPAPTPPDTGLFTFFRSGDTNEALTVFFQLSGRAEPQDYQSIGNSVIIPAGSSSAQVYVVPMKDSVVEGDEELHLSLLPDVNYALGYSSNATITIKDATPWQNRDIGGVSTFGHGNQSNGLFRVSGSGADIAGSSDAFHFYYRPWVGDGTIVARVTQISGSDPWARAGIMFRSSLDSGAPFASMQFRAGGQTFFQHRNVLASDTRYRAGSWVSTPCWLKLIRRGNSFVGYESPDGLHWRLVDSALEVDLPESLLLGLAVTAHGTGVVCTTVFDNLSFSPEAGIPYPPSDLKVSTYRNRFLLSWKDNSTDENSFRVEISGENFEYGGWPVGVLPANQTQFSYGPFGANITQYFRVTATGPLGDSAFSEVVSATSPLLSFGEMSRGSNGTINLQLWGPWEQGCRVESSPDLVHWNAVTNFLNSTGLRTFTDPARTNETKRFYRAVLVP